jgi:hypothetical protein
LGLLGKQGTLSVGLDATTLKELQTWHPHFIATSVSKGDKQDYKKTPCSSVTIT